VFRATGAGVAVAGMIHTGSVQAGDRVLAVPAGETAIVKGLQAYTTLCIVLLNILFRLVETLYKTRYHLFSTRVLNIFCFVRLYTDGYLCEIF